MTADFVWLAFPLFFLYLFLLPTPVAVMGVAVVTVMAITALADQGLEGGEVVGPAVGAGVATLSALAYRALAVEHQHARQLVVDLEEARGRLTVSERERGALEERRRLAREVHDTIAQGLSSIILLTRAAELSPSDDPSPTMRQIGELAQHSLDDARQIVSALNPSDLTGSSLAVALERAAASAAAASGIEAELLVDGEPHPLPVAQEVTMLRVAQGALANTAAHANAGHVQMILTYREDRTTLDVVDDGTGFDPAVVADRSDGSGYGFQVMRERLEEVNGTLVVETGPRDGTALTASIPRGPA